VTDQEKQAMRAAIVKETESWVNTPYHDGAGVKGAGVDCAYLPLNVYKAVGAIPADFQPPKYSPQQWLNSPAQIDRMKLRVVDHTFENIVLQFAKREITEAEVDIGDFVLFKIAASWTHGAIVTRKWNLPDDRGCLVHPIKGGPNMVVGSGINEGFIRTRERRYFTVIE
jgi:cell wall-associated NlpC family hydrolase